jgi:hypothetical protein
MFAANDWVLFFLKAVFLTDTLFWRIFYNEYSVLRDTLYTKSKISELSPLELCAKLTRNGLKTTPEVTKTVLNKIILNFWIENGPVL